MAKTTPKVHHKQLFLNGMDVPLCYLGSDDWFAWLETATSFRYFSEERMPLFQDYSRPLSPISVRKEKRRQGYLWYAYRRAYRQLHKRYVGTSAALTTDRLDEIAFLLNEVD